MGGIGKTTLAKSFVDKFHNQYNNLLWINGADGIEKGFINYELISKLNIFNDIQGSITDEDKFNFIISKLQAIEPAFSLLILDNIDKKIEKSIAHKVKLYPNWKVILTSRIQHSGYQSYLVKPLPFSECISLFFKNYTRERLTVQNRIFAENIIRAVYRHTLTIELLARTLQNNYEYNLQTLWLEIQSNGLTAGLEISIDIDYNRTTSKTTISKCLNIAFSLAEFGDDRFIKTILGYLSILPPIQIEFNTLKNLFKINDNQINKFNETLNNLVERGWLDREIGEHQILFYMHPMIQDTVRKNLKPSPKKFSELIWELSKLITSSIEGVKNDNVVLFTPFVEGIVKKFEKRKDNLSIAKLCQSYASILIELFGDGKKALIYSHKSLIIREKQLPYDHEDILESYNSYSIALRHDKQLQKAEGYTDKIITILLDKPNKSEKEIQNLASYINTKAQIFRNKNNETFIIGALDLFNYAIQILEENKVEHPHLLSSIYDNIGTTYNNKLNKPKEALPYFLKAIEIGEQSNAPKIVNSYNNIAACYTDLNELDKAESNILKVIQHYEQLPNKETNTNLAIAYKINSDLLFEKYLLNNQAIDIENALEFQKKSIIIKAHHQNKIGLAKSYLSFARILNADSHLKDNENALKYVSLSIEIFTEKEELMDLHTAQQVKDKIFSNLI